MLSGQQEKNRTPGPTSTSDFARCRTQVNGAQAVETHICPPVSLWLGYAAVKYALSRGELLFLQIRIASGVAVGFRLRLLLAVKRKRSRYDSINTPLGRSG